MTSSEDLPTNSFHRTKSSSLAQEIAIGSSWTVGAQLAIQAIGLISTIILGRLLMPADFGLVALATTIIVGLQALSEFSFDTALIQNSRAGRPEYDSAWTLSACRNTVIALGVALAAGPIAYSFGDQQLEPIIYCLAVATFFEGFQNVGIVDFRKNLEFHRDLIFRVLGKLASFLVGVPLAFLWQNYWALVVAIVAGSIFRVALSFVMHSYRPRISFAKWRDLVHFSKWLVVSNLFGFISNRANAFIISAISGTGALGVFIMSSEIAGQITSNLLSPMRRALFPGYAKIATDFERLRHMFIDISAVVFLVGTPLTLGIGVTADLLVRIALGDQWLGAIPLIEILSAKEFLQLISAAASPIYLATGRPNYMMVLQIFYAIAIFPLLIFGVQWAGALGAAWATLAGVALMVALDLFLCLRLLSLSLGTVLVAIWRPLISGALMLAAVAALEAHWQPTSMTDSILLLCACVMAGAIIYSASVSFLWMMAGRPHGAENHLITLLKGGLGLIVDQVRSRLRKARAAFGQHKVPRR